MKKIAIICLISILLTGCNFPASKKSCSEIAKDFFIQFDKIMAEWDDATKVANSTSRIALSAPVGNMQTIRRKVDNLDTPECVSGIKDLTAIYMDETIDGFLMFMEQKSDKEISEQFAKADATLSTLVKAVINSKGLNNP